MTHTKPSEETLKERSDPTSRPLRLWKRQVVTAMVFQLWGIPYMLIAAWLGQVDWRVVLVWAPLSLAFAFFVYLGLSLGWALRWKDPTLTRYQIIYSIGSAMFCYAVIGPMRSSSFAMACLALLFSIFALPVREVRWITAYAVIGYGAEMLFMSWLQPMRYPAAEEIANFVIVLTVLPGFALLAERLSALRERLSKQKTELQAALTRVAEIASRDDLTKLPNRRRATEVLDEKCAQARRGVGLFVVLVDIDFFKNINDTYGHPVGDQVLCAFAVEVSKALRPGDLLARWGGEEFLLLLSIEDAQVAHLLVERLRKLVADIEVSVADGQRVQFTASFGVARHHPDQTGIDTIERADKALYRAKVAGRDRVEVD